MPKLPTVPDDAKILAISSQVSVGRVGLSVLAPAYAKLDIEGYYLPTILLASRPGLGSRAQYAIAAPEMDIMLAALDTDGRLDECNGVLTGYFANADQVAVVSEHLRNLRQKRPEITILVDPVIGDSNSGLFVDPTVARSVRDLLVPQASIVTPNRFELGWLTGRSSADGLLFDIDRAARDLGPKCVAVTSAGTSDMTIESCLVQGNKVISQSNRRFEAVPNGTGDLFAGLFLAAACNGLDPKSSLKVVCAALEGVAQASSGRQWLDLTSINRSSLDKNVHSKAIGRYQSSRRNAANSQWVAGVDGCKAGWAVVFRDLSGHEPPQFQVFQTFEDILDAPQAPRIIAVDMPIGLPEQVGAGGRGPEAAVRPHLGNRQSSVFSIPSRSAVYAPDYRTACAVALATSTPPRKVSKQGYMLFEKIKQIDTLMSPDLCNRVYEVHPELAFWRLNGQAAMQTPKKIKGRVNPDGIAERRAVLENHDFAPDFFDQTRPRGVGMDDFVDAGACAVIAARLAAGVASPFPEQPQTDANGITIAIWA